MRLSILSTALILGTALWWGSGAKACDPPAIVFQQQSCYQQPVVVQQVRFQQVQQVKVQQVRVQKQVIVEQQRFIERPIVQRSFSFQRTVIR